MQRRSFLGAMLAAMAAPVAMSNAVARGAIMPIKPPEIIVPKREPLFTGEIGSYENVRFIESPLLSLYTAGGILLAEIPLGEAHERGFDYDRIKGVAFDGGMGSVMASGTADHFKLTGAGKYDMTGKVGLGPGGFVLSSPHVVTGQEINVSQIAISKPAEWFYNEPRPWDGRL